MWSERRTSTLVLAGSVLLNVFLLGVVGERFFAERGTSQDRTQMLKAGPLVPATNVRDLPDAERKAFRGIMRRHRPEIRAAREDFRDKQEIAAADIAATTFDRTKVAADLEAIRTASLAIQGANHAALLEALSGLPQDARSLLVRRRGSPWPGDRR